MEFNERVISLSLMQVIYWIERDWRLKSMSEVRWWIELWYFCQTYEVKKHPYGRDGEEVHQDSHMNRVAIMWISLLFSNHHSQHLCSRLCHVDLRAAAGWYGSDPDNDLNRLLHITHLKETPQSLDKDIFEGLLNFTVWLEQSYMLVLYYKNNQFIVTFIFIKTFILFFLF